MPKIEIEVPENVMKFLGALSNFTGQPVKEIVQEHLDTLPEAILGSWSSMLGVDAEELRDRYSLQREGSD